MDHSSYESDDLLHQYLLFHYGNSEDQLPWSFGPQQALSFPARCVSEGVDMKALPARKRALDVGCAVGRSSFEFGKVFEEVIGIDFSDAFIRSARQLLETGSLPLVIRETGTITWEKTIYRPEGIRGRVQFEQGDAQSLRDSLGSFDCLLAANLLCRLARPADFLERLPGLVNPGGQLIITTPNTWLESFTAPRYWLGATPESGEPLEALKASLDAHFELSTVWDMPFLIREHKRKYQWSVAQASRWIRRS